MKKNIKKILILGLNNIGKKIAQKLKKKYLILIIKNKINLKKVKKFRPDVILSLGYRYKVDDNIINYPLYGSFNLHKSLLPLNRGANPVFWIILNKSIAGISIHKMSNKIDQGPVCEQKKIFYDFSFTSGDLYKKMEEEQYILFFKFWSKLLKSKLKFKKQKKIKNKSKTKKEFINIIRSYNLKNKIFMEILHFLKAATFPPFQNVKIKDKNKIYNIEIKITQINKINKKFKLLKSYF